MDSYDCTRTLNGHDHNISGITFVPNGDFLLSCSRDRTIKLWEMSTGFCVRTYQGHNEWVRQVCINLGGDLLASCSNDEEIIVWTIDNPDPL
mmetsp:Transcript_17208/g.2843  ORF Transcript_17208/g.2843 Transcript_17208/m.2843 type:complete len:92 (+) Transcript_17208:542-817(+)